MRHVILYVIFALLLGCTPKSPKMSKQSRANHNALKYEIEVDGTSSNHLVLNIQNTTGTPLRIRKPVLGASFRILFRRSSEQTFQALTPPGTFLQGEQVVLQPGDLFRFTVPIILPNGARELYGIYSIDDSDTEVQWH